MKLCLDSPEDPKMLELQETWDTSPGELLREYKINQTKRKKCVVVNNPKGSWRSEECFDIRHGDAEYGVCPIGLVLLLSSIS